MKAVFDSLHRRAERLRLHPLLAWLRDDRISPRDRFVFAPVYVNFILGFSDMNRWFLRYPEPKDARERAINHHTYEDETHARLFLEDWKKLGFDDALGWGAAETLEWYYASPHTEVFRGHGMELLERFTRDPDCFVRCAGMTAMETCGHLFFSATVKPATELQALTQQEYRYFGPYHLKRETGHVDAGRELYEDAVLDPATRERAIALAIRVIDMFEEQFDQALAYGNAQLRRERAPAVDSPAANAQPGPSAPTQAQAQAQAALPAAELHAEVRRVLEARKEAAAGHEFFSWMRDGGVGITPREKLRRFVALWTPDVMGYRDLNRYSLRYRSPADPRERAINRWVALLESHQSLFLRDWQHLDMDRLLGWRAQDTLAFYCLGKHTELQRRNMASFVKLAAAATNPILRFWLMTALEASGDAFFSNTRRLAEQAELETPGPLDYLANRHERSHPALPPDDEAEAVAFEREGLSSGERDFAIASVNTVFDAIEQQYDHSLQLAQQNVFRA